MSYLPQRDRRGGKEKGGGGQEGGENEREKEIQIWFSSQEGLISEMPYS